MLSTVYAAEAQFRHETEERTHRFAILESMRNRREALPEPARSALPRRALAWPRPIGVKLEIAGSTTVCA